MFVALVRLLKEWSSVGLAANGVAIATNAIEPKKVIADEN